MNGESEDPIGRIQLDIVHTSGLGVDYNGNTIRSGGYSEVFADELRTDDYMNTTMYQDDSHYGGPICRDTCVRGCFCKPGFVRYGLHCIPQDQCPG